MKSVAVLRPLLACGAVLLLLFGASSLNDRDSKLDAAGRLLDAARLSATRSDSLLALERAARQRDSASLDSLKLRVSRVPKRTQAAPARVYVVDSTSVTELKVTLVSRTEELHAVHVVLAGEQRRADSLEVLVTVAVASFKKHLAEDAERNAVQNQLMTDLQNQLAGATKVVRNPWYKKAGTRVGQAAVVVAAFYLGGKA